jgi:glycosyltransferase involved in cell wall biosynthesis
VADSARIPLVSAIIPTHNRAELLERAVRSVVAQTYPEIEIVIVDDGSSDATADVVRRLSSERPIVYLRNDIARGAPYARNRGIEAASGHFIAGLDDDDEWLPERIARLADAYRPEFGAVTSDDLLVSGKRQIRWRKKRRITRDDVLLSNAVGNQVLVERERLLAIGGFDEDLPAAQDYDVWIRLADRYGSILNVRKPLQRVHVHSGGRITTSSAQYRGYLAVYKKHRAKMSRRQRAYQLYTIRRKVGKPVGVRRFLTMVPPQRWFKEAKGLVVRSLIR